MSSYKFLGTHTFWQLAATLPPLLVIASKFVAHRPSHDPTDLALTLAAQFVTWLLHALSAFFFARACKSAVSAKSQSAKSKFTLNLSVGLVTYLVGYFYWHRFWFSGAWKSIADYSGA